MVVATILLWGTSILGLAGCGPSTPATPVPRPADLSQADPWVADVIEESVAKLESTLADVEAWAILGDLYYVHDDFGLATRAYDASLAIDPDSQVVWYMPAAARRADGDTPGALEAIDQAITHEARTPHLWWRAAEWLIDGGELERAAARAEEAVELGPDDRNAVRMLARVTADLGDRTLTRFVRTDSSYLSARDPRVHLGLGDVEVLPALEVRWPDGRSARLESVAVDRVLRIEPPAAE